MCVCVRPVHLPPASSTCELSRSFKASDGFLGDIWRRIHTSCDDGRTDGGFALRHRSAVFAAVIKKTHTHRFFFSFFLSSSVSHQPNKQHRSLTGIFFFAKSFIVARSFLFARAHPHHKNHSCCHNGFPSLPSFGVCPSNGKKNTAEGGSMCFHVFFRPIKLQNPSDDDCDSKVRLVKTVPVGQ